MGEEDNEISGRMIEKLELKIYFHVEGTFSVHRNLSQDESAKESVAGVGVSNRVKDAG